LFLAGAVLLFPPLKNTDIIATGCVDYVEIHQRDEDML
jgi:hypothetical protein